MKATVTIITAVTLLCAVNCYSQDTIQYQPPVFSYSFSGPDALVGWNKTSTLTTTTGTDYLLMEATGSDAKIYRTVDLPKGRYTCTFTNEDNIHVTIKKNVWGASGYDIYLYEYRANRGNDLKTYSIEFDAPGGDTFIIIQTADLTPCKIKSLEIRPSTTYTFVEEGTDYTQKNWNKTSGTLTANYSSLKIDAVGWDSKIYRSVALEAQEYTISALGENMCVILRSGWGSEDVMGQVILGDSRINNGRFNVSIPTVGNYILVTKVDGGAGTSGEIKGITIKPLLNYQFDYSGCSVDGWNCTSATTLTENTDSLTIDALGLDSKIYRNIVLPPEEYILTVTVRGDAQLQVRPDWSATYLNEIVSSNPTEWQTQSFYLNSESSSNLILVLKVNGGPGASCELKNIRIERAPINIYQPPYDLRGWMTITTTSTWDEIPMTGANLVRIVHKPVDRAQQLNLNANDLFDTYVFNAVLDELEDVVEEAQTNGLKVVIDLHQLPFNANELPLADDALWNHADITSNLCTYWQRVAQRLVPYVSNGTIVGYDLLNEPLNRDNQTCIAFEWRDIAQQVVAAIRAIDKDVWIIYEAGAGGGTNGLDYTKPLTDHKVIYSFHFYTPHSYSHQNVTNSLAGNDEDPDDMISYPDITLNLDKAYLESTLNVIEKFQARYQIPVYVGEFSVVKWADGAEDWFEDVIDIFETRDWMWSVHCWRGWQGWNHEFNTLYYKSGDPYSLQYLLPGEVSWRFEAIKDGLDNNP
jgi:endoglucanase